MAASFCDLPNEVLLQILSPLTTNCLLQLSGVSHRIYALICRILHHRLQLAARLPDHTLLLECYHPSAKLTEPPFYCTYLGTEGLDVGELIYDDRDQTRAVPVGRLAQYKRLYSVYRPQRRPPEEQARRVRHPAGDIPGSRTHPSSAPSWVETASFGDAVRQRLVLDGHELFTQLIASLNLARSGPRSGLFFSFVDVGEGVMRVWRDWLKAAAAEYDMKNPSDEYSPFGMHQVGGDAKILWVDTAKRVGLRLKVCEKKWRRNEQMPLLVSFDEEMPVTYEVEYEDLIVRTSHLVFTLEESLTQQSNQSGKAIVFGSFG